VRGRPSERRRANESAGIGAAAPWACVGRATANSYPKPNPKPKLDLIPKLITVATPPDTHPRYRDPTHTHTHTRTTTHPDTHTSVQIRCALGGEEAATISAR